MKAITMEDHAVYVITDNSTISKFKVKHGEVTKTEITRKLTSASSIVVMDKFLYVIDDVQGLNVLKTSPIGNGY